MEWVVELVMSVAFLLLKCLGTKKMEVIFGENSSIQPSGLVVSYNQIIWQEIFVLW